MGGHSRQKLDLTGQRYSQLTVLRPAANIGERTAWHCLCDCGQEVVVKSVHLRSGHTVSCGCARARTAAGAGLSLTYIDGTCVEMLRSNTLRCNNTSGAVGVDWMPRKRRWRASICFKGKRHYLGSFICFDDAVKARQRGAETLHHQFLSEFAENAALAANG